MGEFQERVFEFSIRFQQPMEDAELDAFLDDFIDLIEPRRLIVSGLGGRLPLLETDGIVSALERGSPTEEDRQFILDWLRQRTDVATAEAGKWLDGWYGWVDTP